MTKHFHRELEKIKKLILTLSTMVEEHVHKATEAIIQNDADLARQVIQTDYEIDEMEVEVEEECLKVMALHQPVAVDLRFLIAVIKINNELERIGDQAVNIAQRMERIGRESKIDFYYDYTPMVKKTKNMLKMSLDSLVNTDLDLAFHVLLMDDEIDKMNKDAYDVIKKMMSLNPENLGYLINMLLVSRHLERLADHVTNIAEEVIYMIEGEIVRHGRIE